MSIKEEVETQGDLAVIEPKMYMVIMLNDDYTSMEFVIEVLMKVFHKEYHEAEVIMMDIHKKGRGTCGVFTYEVAETKVMQVSKLAREQGYPLKAVIEEV